MPKKVSPANREPPGEGDEAFRLLFQDHPVPMWIYDLETLAFLEVNDAAVKKYGYTRDEFLSMSLADIRPPEDVARLLGHVKRERPAWQHSGEWRHRLKDGTVIEVEVTSHTLAYRGRPAVLVMAQDITQRKQMEDLLRESEERNRAILNAFPDLMFVHDREGTCLDYHAADKDMLYVPPEKFLGKKVREVFSPGLASDLTSAIERSFATGELQTYEYQLPIAGQVRAFESRIVPYGSDKVLSIVREVTERKQAEQTLRESEARFAAIFHANPGAVALTRLEDNRLVDVNETWQEVTGYPRAEAVGHTPLELNLWVDARQRERLVEAIRQHGKARGEILLRRKTGEARDLLMSAEQVELAGQRYLLTMAQDITERKQAEAALQESEERHRQVSSLMSDYIYCGLASADGSSVTEWASGAFERITGYSMEEVNRLPGGFSALLFPEDLENVIRQQPRLFEQGSLPVEYRIRRKDGEVRWLRDYMRFVAGDGVGKPARLLGAVQDITERKRAEEEINSARAFLEMIVNMSPFAMWISDEKGTVTRVNRSLCEAINLTETEIVGKYNVLKDENLEIQGVMPVVRAVFEKHEPARFSIPWKAANTGDANFRSARDMHIDVSMFPILDTKSELTNVVCQWVDITERKRAEEEIRQQSEELAAINAFGREVGNSLSLGDTTAKALNGIMEAIQPDLAYLFLREGQTLALKETLFRNPGAAVPVVPPHRVGECMCGLAAQENRALFSRDVFNDWRCTWEECKKVGVKSFAALPLRGGEEVFGVIGFGSLTERDFEQQAEFLETLASQVSAALVNARLFETVQEHAAQLEQRVQERTRELGEAQEQLIRQEKLAVLGQMAGGVGHELRNPLAVITNAVYFLRLVQPEADEKVKEYLRLIENETHNAEKIINDLLDFSRVKSVEREAASVADMLARVFERFPAPPGVHVTLDLPDDLPPVYADPRQVEQVLGNLTVNACQAMPKGGQLTISARAEGDQVAIAVRDTGVGIPPENLDKIFEPLFTTKVKGIGLGLAVSKKLAEANGGRLEVQSASGAGAAFTLYLPVYQEKS
ncbi:MAG: PAS domain S-box protein [Chloroflexota bacterium]